MITNIGATTLQEIFNEPSSACRHIHYVLNLNLDINQLLCVQMSQRSRSDGRGGNPMSDAWGAEDGAREAVQ